MANRKANVTTIDARLVYVVLGVIGLLAVGTLAVLVSRGPMRSSSAVVDAPTPPGAVEPTQQGVVEVAPGKKIDLRAAGVSIDSQSVVKLVAKGEPPVSLADAPIGADEARIWIDGLNAGQPVYDMGDVPPTAPSEARIVVRNIGTADLTISEVGGGCGCTVAVIDDPTVPPGGQTTLRVSYDPRVNQEFGKRVEKLIHLQSNDPLVPIAQFILTANVTRQTSASRPTDGVP